VKIENLKICVSLSAWSTKNRRVLAPRATEDKSNEITAIPKLLELVDLDGAVVTVDAMGCQLEIASKIIEVGGDYILALKGNQPTMHEKAIALFEEACSAEKLPKEVKRMVVKERRRRAKEIREHLVMPAPKGFAEELWGIQSLGMVCRRQIEANGSESGQVRYYISSLRPLPYDIRSHWEIENSLDWSLNVTFSEDKSRRRAGSAAETTALLRRVALSKLHQDTQANVSLKCKRKSAGWSTERLEQILTGNPR
jgi:predicted transposase YbfD/YdcC